MQVTAQVVQEKESLGKEVEQLRKAREETEKLLQKAIQERENVIKDRDKQRREIIVITMELREQIGQIQESLKEVQRKCISDEASLIKGDVSTKANDRELVRILQELEKCRSEEEETAKQVQRKINEAKEKLDHVLSQDQNLDEIAKNDKRKKVHLLIDRRSKLAQTLLDTMFIDFNGNNSSSTN